MKRFRIVFVPGLIISSGAERLHTGQRSIAVIDCQIDFRIHVIAMKVLDAPNCPLREMTFGAIVDRFSLKIYPSEFVWNEGPCRFVVTANSLWGP